MRIVLISPILCADPLYNNKVRPASYSSKDCGYHALLIVGRKKNKYGKCGYLLSDPNSETVRWYDENVVLGNTLELMQLSDK
jgi:hypothetical protein